MRQNISSSAAATYFWNIVDSNHLPMMAWDFDGTILHANDAFLSMLGYSRDEFDNVSYDTIHKEHPPHIKEKFVQELRYYKKAKPFNKHLIKKDGSLLLVKVYHTVARHTSSQVFSLTIPLE